jgi:hypothetical protein
MHQEERKEQQLVCGLWRLCLKAPQVHLCALVRPQVGGEFAVSTEEQQRQIEALKVLEANMEQLTAGDPDMFEGLTIRLYHPDSRPLGTLSYVDWNGTYNQRTAPIASHVAGAWRKAAGALHAALHACADVYVCVCVGCISLWLAVCDMGAVQGTRPSCCCYCRSENNCFSQRRCPHALPCLSRDGPKCYSPLPTCCCCLMLLQITGWCTWWQMGR